MKRKRGKQNENENKFLLSSTAALRMALEDAKTARFIQTSFSDPQQRPHILSRTSISQKNQHWRWIVEVKEEISLSANGRSGLRNIARIEIDPFKQKIVRRLFLKYILEDEYRAILKGRLKHFFF